MAVSSGALRLFSDGLAELYAPSSDPVSQDYPARVVNVVTRLVSADSCSYNQFDGPKILAWHVEPAGTGMFPGSEESFRQRLPEHPVLAYHLVTGNGRALRISDFLSDRQFRSLGLYCDFYRPAEVNYQLAITARAPGGGLIGVALNRHGHDFCAEDLDILDMLRIHIEQAAATLPPRPPLPAPPDSAENSLLTPRQARVLELVADGQSDRGIARTLGISSRTVQAHLQHAYRALDVTSRTEALARLRTR
ncbi:MAG TPA: LuxR C-terminal-related transcriptional regulator [Trebonia sp.]